LLWWYTLRKRRAASIHESPRGGLLGNWSVPSLLHRWKDRETSKVRLLVA
jgi:hypothetical protein